MTDPRPTLIPSLHYNDPAAAVDWLERVFGFERTMLITDKDGTLVHAEMRCGDALIMLGGAGWTEIAKSPASLDGANTQRVHLEVPDVDAQFARVEREGAHIFMEPHDQFYGARTFVAADCEGHLWTFNQHMRDVSNEEMSRVSGLTVTGG